MIYDDWDSGPPRRASGYVVTEFGISNVSVRVLSRRRDRIMSATEQVQDGLLEGLHDGAAPVWPECPRHPNSHPLVVAFAARGTTMWSVKSLVAGAAVWCCPRELVPIARVGSLP